MFLKCQQFQQFTVSFFGKNGLEIIFKLLVFLKGLKETLTYLDLISDVVCVVHAFVFDVVLSVLDPHLTVDTVLVTKDVNKYKKSTRI